MKTQSVLVLTQTNYLCAISMLFILLFIDFFRQKQNLWHFGGFQHVKGQVAIAEGDICLYDGRMTWCNWISCLITVAATAGVSKMDGFKIFKFLINICLNKFWKRLNHCEVFRPQNTKLVDIICISQYTTWYHIYHVATPWPIYIPCNGHWPVDLYHNIHSYFVTFKISDTLIKPQIKVMFKYVHNSDVLQ